MESSAEYKKVVPHRNSIVAVLLVSAFVAILNQTLLNTALPKIMDDLQITPNTAQWLMTGFMLVNGVMIPVTAFLIEKFTTRKLFISAMSLFAIGTLIAGIAPSFTVLLIGRLVQASGAGIMMPLMQTVLLLVFPIEQRGAAMGMAGLVIAFGPAIGPTLSGWIVEHYSWRVLFYVVLPIAIGSIIFGFFSLKNVTKQTNPKIDILSIILSTLGFGGLLYSLSTAGSDGWTSSKVYVSLIIGAIALIIFIWRQLTLEKPILEFRVFAYGTFPLTATIGMIGMMLMLSAELLLPIYIQELRGFTALESGLLLLPGAIVMGVMAPINGRIFDKIGARWLALIGLTIVSIATYQFTKLTVSTSYLFILIVYAVRMFGISMVMMPIATAGLNQLPKRLIPHGTAMNNTLRAMAGAMGTALLVTVMTHGAKGYTPDMSQFANYKGEELKHQIITHGLVHGMNTAFLWASVIAIIGILLSFFVRKTELNRD